MSYVKHETRHLGDDRWLRVSPAAFVVHTWALDYCNEQATDGWITESRAARLVCPVTPSKIPSAWAELVAAGFWETAEDGYFCPTFTAHGIAADEQTKTRAKWSEDKRRRRLHQIGNHEICSPFSCPAARKSTGGQVDKSTEDKQTSPPPDRWTTRPDPTRPDPTLRGGEGSGAADAPTSARATDGTPPVTEKHHYNSPRCCSFPLHNRHHLQPDECPGCGDPRHFGDVMSYPDTR